MAETLRILLVDAHADRRELLKIVLDAAVDGCFVDVIGDPVRLGELLRATDVAAVVAAHPSPWLEGFELIERIRDAFPDAPVILLADEADEAVASAALRLGLADLVVRNESAPLRVRDALARVLVERGVIERRLTDRRAPSAGSQDSAAPAGPTQRRTEPGSLPGVPLTGQDSGPLPPTTPGTAAPHPPHPPRAKDRADAPTAVMKALDRKRPADARKVSIPSGEAPTEVGGRPGLKELVERAQVGWFRCDLDGVLLDANEAFLAVMEAKRGDIRLSRLGLTKTQWKGFIKRIRKGDGGVTETGLELRSVTGLRRVVSLTLRGSSASKDQPVIDGLVVDTTDLETVRGNVAVIELDERRRAKEAEEATAAERERLLGLSHDLQEPLRTVRIYADLLEEKHADTLDSEARLMLKRSRDAAARMEEMVSDLVEEATIDTREEVRTADCEDVLRGVMGNLAAAIADSSAEVSHDSLPIVALPSNQMTQLLQNLVGNAIKYRSDASPRVHVSAERGNGEWLFTVQDNGMGIPEEFQARVFEMFERGSEAESLPGSGIGLAVCRRVVESHGGRIWVESNPGEGSTFQFTVPAAAKERHA